MGIGRLDLFIVVRNQLGDRALLRRALAVEAVMEELARELGSDAALWGLAGLGAEIDAKLAAGNPERRGAIAEELLLTEGVPVEAAAAARAARSEAVERLPPVACALVAAGALVDLMLAELAEPEATFEALDGRVLEHRLRRGARREDAAAVRAGACLSSLGIAPRRAAELALAGCRRVRQDLGW